MSDPHSAIGTPFTRILEEQVALRRRGLATGPEGPLARRVDAAGERISSGTWGICRVCHDPVEAERLVADPLLELCIDHLDDDGRRALEHDLAMAARLQRALMPPDLVRHSGWEVAARSIAAGALGGDLLDIAQVGDGALHLLLGDVSGKGVAASMLAAQLHGTFRALYPLGLDLAALVERVNGLIAASTLPTHYATLAAARGTDSGDLELAVAGHPPPLLLSGGHVTPLDATALPIGLFGAIEVATHRVRLRPGDRLLLYSDGVTEAADQDGVEYGRQRLERWLADHAHFGPRDLVAAALDHVDSFRRGVADDTSVMVVARAE